MQVGITNIILCLLTLGGSVFWGEGIAHAQAIIPGTIEAEDYNTGGEGVGYHDLTLGNSGGQYRSDDVDIEAAADVGGGFDIGWTDPAEWLAYDVTVTTAGAYQLELRVARNFAGNGTVHLEVDGVNATGTILVPFTGGFQNWTTVTTPGIALTAGPHQLRVVFESGAFNLNWLRLTLPTTLTITPPTATVGPLGQVQFAGVGGALPYTYNVETDTTGGATVNGSGLYTAGPTAGTSTVRVTDNNAMTADATVTVAANLTITPPTATVGPLGQVQFAGVGGALPYTYNVETDTTGGATVNGSGLYTAGPTAGTSTVRVTDNNAMTADATVTVAANLTIMPPTATVPVLGQQDFNGVGGVPPYAFIVTGDTTGGASVDFLTGLYTAGPLPGTTTVHMADSSLPVELTADALVTVTSSGTTIPGTIEAEDYNTGGEGVGYHDLTLGNSGGQYRSDDVDIEAAADVGGGFDIGWTDPAEWLAYDVTVTTAGAYQLELRVARNFAGNGTVHLEVDGVNATGTILVPFTGGFQNWTTVTTPGIALTAGPHQLRVVFESGAFNLNWLRLTLPTTLTITPPTATVGPLGQVQFAGVGGALPYTYNVETDTTGGATVNGSGLYTAGPTAGTSTVRVTDNNAMTADATVTVAANLTITPPTATVGPLGQVQFAGVGGALPYTYNVETDTTGGATVNGSGLYTAGPTAGTSTVRVTDNNAMTADATVTVAANLTIMPPTATVPVLGQQDFNGVGGVPPYAFIVTGDTTGGASVDFLTGLYTAGPLPGTTTVHMADSSLPVELTADALVTVTSSGTTIPGTIEAEDYNTGGEGVGYHDLTLGNSGGQYRSDDVDIEAAADVGGGFDIGWTDPAEWLAYDVTVTTAGAYQLELRVARNFAGNGTVHLEVDGVNATGTILVPFTGGFQNWTTVTTPGIALTAGPHQLRVVFESGAFNLNWLRLTLPTTLTITPPTATVGPLGQVQFAGVGGALPYTYNVETDTTGGATVNGSGLYTAGPTAGTSTVRVTDNNAMTADATVTVAANLTITPPTATVGPLGQVQFAGVGGALPYTYNVETDTTGGATVNGSGLYTAGPTAGTSTVRVTDNNAMTADATVTVAANLTITPPTATVGPLGQVQFAGVGGALPYTYNVETDTTGGATVNGSGLYTAGPTAGTSTVRVTDNNAMTADATVTVAANLTIMPPTATVPVLGQQDFNGVGGVPPYAFIVTGDTTGGASVDFLTGLYTAGPLPGTTTVHMADSSLPVELTADALVTVTSSGTTIPGTIEAEDYNTGGEGVGYHDLTLGNSGGQYRSDDVDIEAAADVGGGFDIGWTDPAEWLAYDVTVTTAGAYQLELRVARNFAGNGTVHLEVDGVNATGTILVPFTGGFQNWTTVTTPGIALTAGPHQLRVVFESGAFNLNWLRLTLPTTLTITPPTATVGPLGQVQFAGVGGALPYTYNVETDTTGGATVNGSGLYTAGPTAGTSTVRVTDNNFNTKDVGITVFESTSLVSQSGWTIHFVDSQGTGGSAVNAIDGMSNTEWRTQSGIPFPHDLQIDLGNVFELEGFRVIALTPVEEHAISFFEFFVSEDGVSWGAPVASGELSKDFSEMEVNFPRISGQFIRIRPLGWHDGGPAVAIGELNVLGAAFSGNYAPNGTIDSPTGNVTISVGQSVSFMGTYTDSNGHPPLSFLWDFGDSSISNVAIEDPGSITFNNPGTYTVTFTVTDAFGLSDPIPGSVVVKVLAGANSVIPRGDWTIEFVNSEEVPLNAATNVLDGDTNTIWHTQINDVNRPHEIHFNLGAAYAIDGFRYFPRQTGEDGRIEEYHIYVSADGKNWGTPVAIGQFANNAIEQRVQFSPKIGQFIRLVAITEVNGNRWASMAEANVEGVCQDPFVRIINPLTNEVQGRPDLTVTASVCLTQAAHAGWGVKFSVDGGAQEQTITLPVDGVIHPDTFQWTFAGLSGDNHQIEAFIVDALGMPVVGNNTSDIITNIGIGDVFAAIGDSITVGVGDDDNTDGTSQDGRNTNTGLGFIPILNDILTAERLYPHNIHNDGISGDSSAGVLVRAPKILKSRKKTSAFLILIGSNDANSGLVPSGKGPNPPGPGTFKDNLQQIIDLLHNPAQGREVYLAKVPYTTNAASIPFILDYNIAIDELVTQNGLPDVPDFFTHFQTSQLELAGDGLHPNGNGYKSMASLWCIEVSGGACPIP